MFRTKERSQALRKALKEHFLSGLMARGYVKVKHTSLLYQYMSVKNGNVIGIEVDWNKYHGPKFVIFFSFVPLVAGKDGESGFEPLYGTKKGTWYPANEIVDFINGTYIGSIHAGLSRWVLGKNFSYSLLKYYTDKNACEKVMAHCLDLVISLETEIEAGTIQGKFKLDDSCYMENMNLQALDWDAMWERNKLIGKKPDES